MENNLKLLQSLPIQPPPTQPPVRHTGSSEGRSLRILVVLSQQPGETGSGVYLREITSELQKLGHTPFLLAAHYRKLTSADFPFLPDDHIYTMVFDDGTNADSAEIRFPIPGMSLDMPYLHLPFHKLSEPMLDEYCGAWVNKLRTILPNIQPDILHVNHLWLLPGIARVAAPRMPIVATTHGTDYKLLQVSPSFSPLVLPGVQSLDAVMPVSRSTADQTMRSFGVREDRVHVIGNGYNPDLFRLRPRGQGRTLLEGILRRFHDLPPWDKLVLYVGKFADYKGLPYLIHAAGQYSEASEHRIMTLVVGGGSKEARGELEKLVRAAGLEGRVVLPGKLPYQEISLLMNMADVFVLPSVDEPFGLVLLEALACGVRAVAADRGGPAFFVPQALRMEGLVTLVRPLQMLNPRQPDPADQDRYAADLAAAILDQLAQGTTHRDRSYISNAVKNETWHMKTREIVGVYTAAIQLHRH